MSQQMKLQLKHKALEEAMAEVLQYLREMQEWSSKQEKESNGDVVAESSYFGQVTAYKGSADYLESRLKEH